MKICTGPGLIAAALLFAAPAALAQEKLVHSERSQYREVRVYETNGERCMCFTISCRIGRQSCIELANPHRFALNYARMMMGGTLLTGRGAETHPHHRSWRRHHPLRVARGAAQCADRRG